MGRWRQRGGEAVAKPVETPDVDTVMFAGKDRTKAGEASIKWCRGLSFG
jgi:hypothetical protein